MISNKQLFLNYVGQTSPDPLALEFVNADGIYLYDNKGKVYIDLVSGVSVSNLGHAHPLIINSIIEQVRNYSHLMVYGEYIQSPQTELAKLLSDNLPTELDNVYFVNSGSEAIEGAMKLAKNYTGRSEIISFKNAYHGSTQGALSILGDEKLKTRFRPLIPGTRLLEFNNINDLEKISEKTACVIAEVIQAEAGIIPAKEGFLNELRNICSKTGALLIFDEIQTAFGRTGSLFAFEHYNVIPDIICLAKAMGGGMPLGAFISSKNIMKVLSENPALGHITTFGGHPVSCAAGLASLKILLNDKIIFDCERKAGIFRQFLKHHAIKAIRGKGLFLAVELDKKTKIETLLRNCINRGIIFDLFLFCKNSFRIAPPLIITDHQIKEVCDIILKALDNSCE